MKNRNAFVLKGNICHNKSPRAFETVENGYLVCEDGLSQGVFSSLPERYRKLPLIDYKNCVILPGLVDLHVHAPQFALRGLGMDLELLGWLNTHVFPEEAKYGDLDYAQKAYSRFVEDVGKGPNTRAAVFATRHVPATIMLMDMLEQSGLVTQVGKVNMDRNSHPDLQEADAARSLDDTVAWLAACAGRYENTRPILTPRFIPSCSDELMEKLGKIRRRYGLAVQSHLSENKSEIEWVRELCPWSKNYADAYKRFDLLGGDAPTVMAHCVHSSPEEVDLLRENGVFVAHCPQSNANLSSGIAPIRSFLRKGVKVGLGSDVAGGSDTSIFRIISDAIRVSKLHWRLSDQRAEPLVVEEAFYLGTMGGGEFFGKVGCFRPGYEFDAIAIDDSDLKAPFELSIADRVTRIVYYADESNIRGKYARGFSIL